MRAARIGYLVVIAVLATMAVTSSARAESGGRYAVTNTLKVGGPGSWDYVTVDSQDLRLYLTRTTHTMVLELPTGKVLADIPGQKCAHGVAIVPKVGRGFISDGQDGSVTVFDLKSNEVLGKVAAADDADGIIYDPVTHTAYLPAVEYEEGAAAAAAAGRRPAAKPDSFMVLVVAPAAAAR